MIHGGDREAIFIKGWSCDNLFFEDCRGVNNDEVLDRAGPGACIRSKIEGTYVYVILLQRR